MPAGIFILISSCLRRVPWPLHSWRFSLGIFPVPSQTVQARPLVNCPRIEWRASCTLPLPLHVVHVSIVVPGFAPEPRQRLHLETFEIKTLRLVPNTAALKENFKSIEISRPPGGCWRAPRPEKK